MKGIHQANNRELTKLYRAVLSLKTVGECNNFFRDLLTIEEITELSKRWQAAQMVNQGQPYRQISKKTGLSTTTVARVANWLRHGHGGYRLALKRSRK